MSNPPDLADDYSIRGWLGWAAGSIKRPAPEHLLIPLALIVLFTSYASWRLDLPWENPPSAQITTFEPRSIKSSLLRNGSRTIPIYGLILLIFRSRTKTSQTIEQ
ncbi:hypothetical protein [Luteolibacter sp. AS25]|uniref:hypothetical protein n=1 Tax=Luteolibacter sp. AS25 TaxID=3135776 RepID=UPI00398B5C80